MPIDRLPFGRTGHESSRALFGAAALSRVTQDEADRALEVLLRYGVNHIDVAASYGAAEERVKPWLARYPGHFFLATKTDAREKAAAWDDLRRSLDRISVDHVDLWQLHNLADPIEWDTVLSPGGVIEAAVEARDQGLVRFIGVTGHGSQIAATHRRSLERFAFDAVLAPYNYLTMRNPYYAEQFDALAATCEQRGVALQTIKSIALRPWMGRERTATTWYEPLRDPADIALAVHWTLRRPGIFLNTIGDLALLPLVLDAAERAASVAPTDDHMAAMLARLDGAPLFV